MKPPPLEDASDTVSDLMAIAVAGGTGAVSVIDTGELGVTTSDLATVRDGIDGAR